MSWSYDVAFGQNVRAAQDYWQRPVVEQEVAQAYRCSFGAPGFKETRTAADIRKTILGALIVTNQAALAQRECAKLKGPLSRAEAAKWGPYAQSIVDFCSK
jgi:hypothetical protein